MARISEHIERHATRALRAAQERARATGGRVRRAAHATRAAATHVIEMRKVWSAFGLLAGLLIITSLTYLWEQDSVESMIRERPIACASLLFGANTRLCEERIPSLYATVADRGPICADRHRYGPDVPSLCEEYDTFMTVSLHGASLSERGISVWMPTADVEGKRIVLRTTSRPSDAHLVCGAVIPCEVTIGEDITTMDVLAVVDGTCTVVATTDEGSVTSAPFNLTTE